MVRKLLAVLLLGATMALGGCGGNDTMSSAASMLEGDSLVSGLTSGLGIDAKQAAGGLGSIMSLAENKLPAADYSSLTKLMPSADKYLKVAKDAGLLTDPITDASKLYAAMGDLGINADTASKLYSQVGDYLGDAGGASAKNMLMGLL